MLARENPFRLDKIRRLDFRLNGYTWDSLWDKLSEMNFRAAIVGGHGSGKTTLLEKLQPKITAKGYKTKMAFANQDKPYLRSDLKMILADMDNWDICLLDGADHLPAFSFRSLKQAFIKADKGLIITVHKPSKLPTLIKCSPDLELFKDIISELLRDHPLPTDQEISLIYNCHRGNLREALWDMYDIWAERKGDIHN